MPQRKPSIRRESFRSFFQRELRRNIKDSAKIGANTREVSFAKQFGKKPYSTTVRVQKKDLAEFAYSPVGMMLAMQERAGGLSLVRPVRESLATTLIHNHPMGTGSFSAEDIKMFLNEASKNKRLRYNVIVAHNSKGRELGRTVLYYPSSKAGAKKLLVLFKKALNKRFLARRAEIRKYPEKFRQLGCGDNILSSKEEREFVLDFLRKHNLKLYYIPVKGRVYNKGSDTFWLQKK
ncbi:MAG: hypothetical protein NTY48_05185 [Candidatus Diapherotrites archaeon]|nr:hypothetical protein [Candidatus Diapherotrites archaeon]